MQLEKIYHLEKGEVIARICTPASVLIKVDGGWRVEEMVPFHLG